MIIIINLVILLMYLIYLSKLLFKKEYGTLTVAIFAFWFGFLLVQIYS